MDQQVKAEPKKEKSLTIRTGVRAGPAVVLMID